MAKKVEKKRARVWIDDDLYFTHGDDRTVGHIGNEQGDEVCVSSDNLRLILAYMEGVAETEARTFIKEEPKP